ncbi:MAG: SusC/RagA family TonB-linked outer membrane protein, partial [Bacteroidota bacterium]
AANGVVLITTKTGSRSEKPTFTYNGYYGVQNVQRTVDLLNADQYVQVMNQAGVLNIDPNQIQTIDTDWQDELYTRNAPVQSHYIGLEGGSEKTVYTASVSYFDQEGIIGGELSSFQRYTGRLNSRSKVNDYLSWGQTINYSHTQRRGVDGNSAFNGELGSALNMDPLTPVFEENPANLNQFPYATEPVLRASDGRFYAVSTNVAGEIVNPLARLQLRNLERSEDQVQGNLFVEVQPIENLVLKSTASLDLIYRNWDNFTPEFFLNSTFSNLLQTNVSRSNQRQSRFQLENTANYTRSIGKHNINVLVGTTLIDENNSFFSASTLGLDVSNPNLRYLSLGVSDTLNRVGASAGAYRLASVFSRILYDYNSRISFSLSQRRDGSSRFGPNNKFANFYAFGASWVINEESFFPKWKSLSFLKLRASWGQNGNDRIRDFRYASLLDFNVAYNQRLGISQLSFADASIGWETSTLLDIAVDAGFFDNKLTVTLDYYKKTTDDLLQEQVLPSTIGFSGGETNIGSVENEGLEMSLNWRDQKGKLKYAVGLNASYNQNTMTRVASDAGFISGRGWALIQDVTRIIEGQPMISFFGYKTDGIFQSEAEVNQYISQASDGRPIQPNAEPGDIRYVDTNNDGMITPEDRVAIGSPLPDWTVGANLSLEYGNFDFSALFSGWLGVDVFNGTNRYDIFTANRQSWILDQWTPENPSQTIPRFVNGDPNFNYTQANDLVHIQNGSFIRLRNIQLGYNIPAKITNKIKVTSWRWFVAADNLVTFTGYQGTDPEVGAPDRGDGTLDVLATGIDSGIYPQARSFRIGTVLTF